MRKFGFGAVLAIAVIALAYWFLKSFGDKIKQGSGFLFGGKDAPTTVGSNVYDFVHSGSSITYDHAQIAKTCRAIHPGNESAINLCIAKGEKALGFSP